MLVLLAGFHRDGKVYVPYQGETQSFLAMNCISVMGTINHFLIKFKALPRRQGSCLVPLTRPRIYGLIDTALEENVLLLFY